MHSRCCWPPDSVSAEACSRSCDLAPDRRGPQALLDALVDLAAVAHAVDAQPVRDVLEDRLRERVRLLEHHADAPPQRDDVRTGRVDRLSVEQDVALDA